MLRFTYRALLVAVLLALLHLSTSYAQTTTFSNPVAIQPTLPPQATLTVNRLGTSQLASIDLFSNGGGDQMRFFNLTPQGQVLRSFFNDAGAFYTNSWMVISGQLDENAAIPIIQPTNDDSMVSIWSDVVTGPALVIRPNTNSHPDADVGFMDNFGDYRLVVTAAGSLNFAGPGGNTTNAFAMGVPYANTLFDTDLRRFNVNELGTDGGFSALHYSVPLLNAAGVSVSSGTVLSVATNEDNAFTLSSSDADDTVIGVAVAPIPLNKSGDLIVQGISPVNVVAPVSRGNLLVSAGNGRARALSSGEVPAAGAIIGKALSGTTAASGDSAVVNAMVNIM